MKYNKKDVKKFALGEFVGAASQLGSLIPGAGPIIGAVGGIGASIIGGLEAAKAKKIADKKQKAMDYTAYSDQMTSQLDTVNQNPFGNQLFADGGKVPKKPLITNNKNDPKLKAYNDSLGLYKSGKQALEKYWSMDPLPDEVYQKRMAEPFWGDPIKDIIKRKGMNKDKIKPVSFITKSDIPVYKKPTTPVKYVKPKPKVIPPVAPVAPISTSQPNISLPNWDGLVEKVDGSVGQWGNPITNTKPVVASTFAPPMGHIDHLGRKSGQLYQGLPATRDKIFEMEKKLKAQSSMKGYADGAEVQENQINIEKGELQIDPQSGKILREYKGVNPETGGLYEAHSKKGQDPIHNLVNADPGTFIITKAKAKQYKDAVDNNDKITKATVLQNIRNHKQEVSAKYADGDFVLNAGDMANINGAEAGVRFAPSTYAGAEQSKFDPSSLIGLAPGLINMFQGNKQAHKMDRVNPIINPMKNQVLNQMPDDVSLAPIKQELFNQQKNIFNQIDNSTSSSAVARANKNNVFANTSNQLGKLGIEQQMSNNQIKGQRSQLLNQLGGQDMQAQQDARQYNYNIDNTNDMKDIAKQQQMNLGISQLQELYLNNKKNKSLGAMDDKRLAALKAIFPRLADSDYAEMLSRGNK